MRTNAASKICVMTLRVGLCLTLAACAQSTELPAPKSGQTHWLMSCGDGSACGDLSCVCGVCALPCTDDLECSAQIAGSRCQPADASATQSICGGLPAPAMCLLPCETTEDCPARQSCQARACVPERYTIPFSDAGASDGGGTFVTGSELQSSTTTSQPTVGASGSRVGDCVAAEAAGWVAETLAVNVWFSAQVDSLLDRNGRLHVAYVTGPTLVHQVLNGKAWRFEQVDRGSEPAWGIDMAEATDGTLHLVAGGREGLRHYVLHDAVWTRTLVAENFARQVSIALDAQDEPQIAYAVNEDTLGPPVVNGAWFAERVDGRWVNTLIDEHGYPRGLTLVLGHPSGPEILYYTPLRVQYARRESGTWQVHALGEGIDTTAIRVNDTELMAAWGGHDFDNMTIARLNDGIPTWSMTLELPGNFGVAQPSLAIGQGNELHMLHDTSHGYAYLHGVEGAVESNDLFAAESNYPPSLTLDAAGTPHAFVGDGTSGDLLHIYQGSCAP